MRPEPLTKAELAELERVAKGDYNCITQPSGLLLSLMAKGLVEARPVMLLPLLPLRSCYQLTACGKEALGKIL